MFIFNFILSSYFLSNQNQKATVGCRGQEEDGDLLPDVWGGCSPNKKPRSKRTRGRQFPLKGWSLPSGDSAGALINRTYSSDDDNFHLSAPPFF